MYACLLGRTLIIDSWFIEWPPVTSGRFQSEISNGIKGLANVNQSHVHGFRLLILLLINPAWRTSAAECFHNTRHEIIHICIRHWSGFIKASIATRELINILLDYVASIQGDSILASFLLRSSGAHLESTRKKY